MNVRAITPPEFCDAAAAARMSPAVISNNHIFLTGVTGAGSDGTMPEDLETQFHNVFYKIGSILGEAGLSFSAIVEMTSYHIGLRDHFDLFDAVRLKYVNTPYPAWTAVEAAGLRREGAMVEVRVVANVQGNTNPETPHVLA